MNTVMNKPQLTNDQLEALGIDLMLQTATKTLTEARFDEIVETFISANVPIENLIQTIAQGAPAWRVKYTQHPGRNAFDNTRLGLFRYLVEEPAQFSDCSRVFALFWFFSCFQFYHLINFCAEKSVLYQ
jgi:hypothetical protein